RFGGVDLVASDVENWLTGVGFSLRSTGAGEWDVEVPTWRYYDMRPDPAQPIGQPQAQVFEADLFEEVLRLHGLEGIPSTLPAVGGPDQGSSLGHERRQEIRGHLAASGYLEAINFAFHEEGSDRRYPVLRQDGEPVKLANPLSELFAVMRRSLVPGLVAAAEFNLRRGCQALRLFEIGHIFPGGQSDEVEMVGLIGGGQDDLPWSRRSEYDLFELKGVVENLSRRFGVDIQARPADLPGLVRGTASYLHDAATTSTILGYLGQIDSDDTPYPLFVAELDVSGFCVGEARPIELPSRYPGVEMDLTLTQHEQTPWWEIAEAVHSFEVQDLVEFGLKDRYAGDEIPSGAVNTTLYFFYNALDSSLTREAVNERHEAMREMLERRFGWKGE
ncbi:MAG: hypothetical protein P8Y44_02385, partial [Acidobacteriota bacterium]